MKTIEEKKLKAKERTKKWRLENPELYKEQNKRHYKIIVMKKRMDEF